MNSIKYYSKSTFSIWNSLLFYLTMPMLLILGSCVDDSIDSVVNAKEVEVKVFLKVPAASIAQTRSGQVADYYYDPNGIYLLVFDGNRDESALLQIVKASAGSNIFYAKLAENRNARYIYVIANMQDIISSNQDNWKKNGSSLAIIKSQLQKQLSLEKGVATEMITPQPMLGEVYLKDGIGNGTQVGSSQNPVELSRSTVKISIGSDVNGFVVTGANLMNAPIAGYLFGMPETIIKNIAKANSGFEGDPEKMIATPSFDGDDCYLYTFESVKDTKATSVIIKTSYLNKEYFYRIDLDTKDPSYALMRNCNYMVRIKSVKKTGYSTAEEARNNPAGNIEYSINVVDSYSRDIISNGQYYLGVSNTEFYYYTDDSKMENMQIAVITQNAPATISAGYCEPSNGITVTENPFPQNNGTAQSLPLSITMDPSVNEGTIKLVLGSLERTIKVYRMPSPDKFEFGNIFKNFLGKGYISGKVVSGFENWIKLTNKEIPTEEQLYNSLEEASENIYIRVKANLGSDSDPKYRTGALDLFSKDEGGNAHIVFKQKMFDVYTPSTEQAKLRPFTYVGTFHRWNHTGERIIRVDTKVNGNGSYAWRAIVISGDFIRLSQTRSLDGGVGTTNFYGTGDNTNYKTDEAVESLQVTDGKTEIEGTGNIYFRVGLTGKLASKESKPRYGLIALIVNYKSTNPITRYIYVRQGEAADYLMEHEDPINIQEPRRPKAIKISPYNLTDPVGDDSYSDLTGKQGVFTQYPSQAGYLYQGYTRKGWWADAFEYTNSPSGWDQRSQSYTWENKYETCPRGYRHPTNGNDGVNDDAVMNSEMRQSMWIYPQSKMLSETQNFIVGYLADGYYDRRPMSQYVNFGNNKDDEQPSKVGSGTDVAYMGVLGFNPRTLASIFFPLAGYYWGYQKINYLDSGISGGFRTQTRYNSLQIWSVDYGYLYPSFAEGVSSTKEYRVDNYAHTSEQASSVRCVKE